MTKPLSTATVIYIVGIGGTLGSHSTSLWALKRALQAAQMAGATTELLSLRDLDLPMYNPEKSLQDYDRNVHHFLSAVHRADAMLWSTSGYHGTLAGVTKNALDFLEFLSGGEHPYLDRKVVGLIATAGGEIAAVNSINAMVHVVHALRGMAAPLLVAIPQAHKAFDAHGNVLSEKSAGRLDQLGRLVVDMATNHRPDRQFALQS